MKLHSTLSGLLAAVEAVPHEQHPGPGKPPKDPQQPPNILFIMTDDQDLMLNSVAYMPLMQKHIRDKGIEFANHFVTTALCCPSRVSLWTGKQAHNTNVTDVHPPFGGYTKFVSQGLNEAWLPVWLQDAGYNTYYTGKLMNGHRLTNYDSPFPKGWTGSDFLLDPNTYSYHNSTYQRNQDPPKSYAGHHTSEVIAEKAMGFLEDALGSDKPFFLGVSPVAPHTNIEPIDLGPNAVNGPRMTEPVPLEKHMHLFKDTKVPRTPNFNPTTASGASYVLGLPLLNQTVIDYQDHFYRQRLRSLQSVDELVDSLVRRLEESGRADNTYIFYTADNGFHIGNHRLPPGKTTGYEEDIHVPLFVRGPGIPKGKVERTVTTHIDLAPTFLEIAGVPLRKDFDGTPMPVNKDVDNIVHEHVTVEYWGVQLSEGEFGNVGPNESLVQPNNSYKATRIVGSGYSLYYSVWCTNEHELYDMKKAPYQMDNLWGKKDDKKAKPLLGRDLTAIISRLDALVLVLKSCKGETCIRPWNVLHPDGSVSSLRDALEKRYDAFYDAQPKVSYSACIDGYLTEYEGPQEGLFYRDGLSWEAWV